MILWHSPLNFEKCLDNYILDHFKSKTITFYLKIRLKKNLQNKKKTELEIFFKLISLKINWKAEKYVISISWKKKKKKLMCHLVCASFCENTISSSNTHFQ